MKADDPILVERLDDAEYKARMARDEGRSTRADIRSVQAGNFPVDYKDIVELTFQIEVLPFVDSLL